jgi:hypothetical protein
MTPAAASSRAPDLAPALRHPVFRVLRHVGLVDDDMVAGRTVEVRHLSSSHTVVRVRIGDDTFIVKHVNAATRRAGRRLDTELAVHRLAGTDAELRSVVPAVRFADDHLELLVVDEVRPGTPVRRFHHDPVLAAAIGRALGTWHAGTAGRPFLPAPAPWPLSFAIDPSYVLATQEGAARAVLERVAADPALRDGLAELACAERRDVLVHGDLKSENCILDGRPGGPHVRLVDWELAGSGDAVWDLGAVLAESLAARGRLDLAPADEALVRAYVLAGRSVGAAAVGQRPVDVVRSIATRLVVIAFERTAHLGDGALAWAAGLLVHARRLATEPEPLAVAVRRCVLG